MPSQHPEARKLISQGVFDSIKSFKDFEGRVTKLIEINTTLGGNAFEIFVEAYLINQPKMQCAKVFVVKQLPLDITKELNLPNDGKGVDGVYKSFSEISVPYQVKFRSNRPPLSLSEVSTFLGLTERAKDRVLITNCDEIARDVKNRDYLRSIRGQDFDLLEEADFELIEAWLKEKPVKRELPKPKPYQLIALEDIKKALGSHDRATAVMACGTGKTLIALWAAQQAEANTVLVLLPSLTLMQQTLLEWSKNNSWGIRFSFICVCSDLTVKANDEIEIDPTDIDFKVDTDPELVKQFLNQKNEKVKVVFSTYQSSKIVGEAIKGLNPFDFAVFDEAHKTTGPKGGVFAFTLDNQNISIKKRLFLTATPRHYDIKKRDKEGEFKVISMDDESIYGPRAHSLTFGSAASQGIICNYKIIISLIDKSQVDDFALKNGITLIENDKIGARWVAAQIALQQAIEKVNASKIITFHSRVKYAQEFSSETSHGIKRYLKDFKVMHVNGKQRSNERTGLIRQFKDSPRSLITNARCLTEGVDVPAVDMVAFIDARHSKVDIAQAIGRAMRIPRGSNKKFGYIIVPLFADTSDLNNLEETIKKEGFDDVAEILNALQEQDEELVDIIKELQEAKGRGEAFNPKRLSDKVETIGPFINLEEISANVYTEILTRFGVSWDFWFGLLQKYKNKFGNLVVPHRHNSDEGFALGHWVDAQRARRKILPTKRVDQLNSIGFIWDVIDHNWNLGFSYLKEYYDLNKNSLVPARFKFKNNFKLGTWVAHQRSSKSALSEEQLRMLEEVNFIWDVDEYEWNIGYESLKKYYEVYKNALVRFEYVDEENFPLGGWVSRQRTRLKRGTLNQERIEKLNSLNFIWNVIDEKWEVGYRYLEVFFKENNHSDVRYDYLTKDGYRLGDWVYLQRSTKNEVSEARREKLDSLNFIWFKDDVFEEFCKNLVKYKSQFGDLFIINEYVVGNNYPLGKKNIYYRNMYSKFPDDNPYKVKLNSLGFIWNFEAAKWDLSFKELEDYNKKYGSCIVPKKYKSPNTFRTPELAYWVSVQRKRKDLLTSDQIKKLESLNFVWDILAHNWEMGFGYLKEFKEKFGHISTINTYVNEDGFGLGEWVSSQRKDYKAKKISQDRLDKLNSIGFMWVVGKGKNQYSGS